MTIANAAGKSLVKGAQCNFSLVKRSSTRWWATQGTKANAEIVARFSRIMFRSVRAFFNLVGRVGSRVGGHNSSDETDASGVTLCSTLPSSCQLEQDVKSQS